MGKIIQLKDENGDNLYPITKKSAITISQNANKSYSVGSNYGSIKVLLDTEVTKIGNNLEFTDNQIKVKKTGYYRVNANLTANATNANYIRIIQLKHNSNVIGSGYISGVTSYLGISASPRIVYAEKGDVFALYFSGSVAASYTISGNQYTYLTVEEV